MEINLAPVNSTVLSRLSVLDILERIWDSSGENDVFSNFEFKGDENPD